MAEAEEQKKKDQHLYRLTEEQAQGNVFGMLLMFLLGLKPEEGDLGKDSIANNQSVIDFSNALNIDVNLFKGTLTSVLSGDTTIGQAAADLYRAIPDPSTQSTQQADQVLADYNGRSNLSPVEDANFLDAVNIVLKLEGGWNPNEPDGGFAMYGINNIANPDIDVKNLSQSAAVNIYKERYWDQIDGIENLDQRAALVAFDLAVNSGPGRANKFLLELESEGKANLETGQVDLQAFFEKREDFYNKLITGNPAKYERYSDGWETRLEHLAVAVTAIPNTNPMPDAQIALLNTNVSLGQESAKIDNSDLSPEPIFVNQDNNQSEHAYNGVPLVLSPEALDEIKQDTTLAETQPWKNISLLTAFTPVVDQPSPEDTSSFFVQNQVDMGTATPVGLGVLLPEHLPNSPSEDAQNDSNGGLMASMMPGALGGSNS